MISAIFPSSPGWNWSEPTWIQRRAPLIGSPITGNRGRKSRPSAVTPKTYLYRSSTR